MEKPQKRRGVRVFLELTQEVPQRKFVLLDEQEEILDSFMHRMKGIR